jgi:transposase
MRFAPIKSDAQLEMQSLHRVRESWVGRRTSVVNQIRGLLLERGITIRKGRRHADAYGAELRAGQAVVCR